MLRIDNFNDENITGFIMDEQSFNIFIRSKHYVSYILYILMRDIIIIIYIFFINFYMVYYIFKKNIFLYFTLNQNSIFIYFYLNFIKY